MAGVYGCKEEETWKRGRLYSGMGLCGSTPDVKDICLRCARHGRGDRPNYTQSSFRNGAVCRRCYEEMAPDEKVVFEHEQGNHDGCRSYTDYPETELKFEGSTYHDQRRAEWRHFHGDHSLCKPEFVLGCTEQEKKKQEMYEQASQRYTQANAVALEQVAFKDKEQFESPQSEP